jgi:hypothetical protein
VRAARRCSRSSSSPIRGARASATLDTSKLPHARAIEVFGDPLDPPWKTP